MPTSPHWESSNSHWIFEKTVYTAGSMLASTPRVYLKTPNVTGSEEFLR